MPYIGGKHRLSKEIAMRLHAPGVDTLVEVFGGSAAVMLNAGFNKRVYNDSDQNIVNVFRTIADTGKCRELLRKLHCMPPSRAIFEDCHHLEKCDDLERAARVLYRQLFAFGGKGTDGGFSVSVGDRWGIKEVARYQSLLVRLESFAEFFSKTLLECLDYQELIRCYGVKRNVVLFCDPPYVGTERYYRMDSFGQWHHWNLAQMLNNVSAHVVLTYYDVPMLRSLYPAASWTWEVVSATKNCQFSSGNKQKVDEYIISKKEVSHV
jgi:DNA adenine methylase